MNARYSGAFLVPDPTLPMTDFDPFIRLPGAINLRDFGGYRTSDGRRIRRGLLFRCGAMSGIDPDYHQAFADLDIGVICDLRRDEEVEMSPTPTHAPFDVRVHIPIDPGSTLSFRESLGDQDATADDRRGHMRQITREIAREHAHNYRRVFAELVNTDRGFLIHCSAGKDRTGFGAAMIQTLLGVDHETVMADYLLSNEATELRERMAQRIQEMYPHIDDESLGVMAGVQADYLLAAMDEIDEHFGGTHGYFEEVGLTPADIEDLKARYLES